MGEVDRAVLRHAWLSRTERQPASRARDFSTRMSQSFLRKSLAGFKPYVPGEQPPDGEGWVKLNTNESPLPPSPKAIAAIRAAAGESLRLYPSPTAAPARAAISRHVDLDVAPGSLGHAAGERLQLCFRAFTGAGDRVAY